MNKNFIAIIPARGGSKGLPKKNILELHAHPLIAWSIQFAKESKIFSRCIVTTDSQEIATVASQYGAEIPFIRSAYLSNDRAKSSDVILDVIKQCNLPDNDVFFLLEPTSPYRLISDLYKAIALYKEPDTKKVISVTEAGSASYFFQYLRKNGSSGGHLKSIQEDGTMNIVRRQETTPTFYLDGTFYADEVASFKSNPTFLHTTTKSVVTEFLSSFEIDTPEDLELYRAIFSYFGPPFDI